MANEQAAKEWLTLAHHDLNGAKLMFEASHYTDTISYVLHQSIEKSLKSILAFENKSIKKTHNLIELHEIVSLDTFNLSEDEILTLSVITTYYSKQKYPNPNYSLPSQKDIEIALKLASDILNNICILLGVNLRL